MTSNTQQAEAAQTTSPIFSPYGGFSEGDHVTRDGTDVHLVKDMSSDGFSATFVCTVAPATGWTQVGEEEPNLCRRYARLKRDIITQEWILDQEATPTVTPPLTANDWTMELLRRAFRDVIRPYIRQMAKDICRAFGLKEARRHRATYYQRKTGRRPKRRALRK